MSFSNRLASINSQFLNPDSGAKKLSKYNEYHKSTKRYGSNSSVHMFEKPQTYTRNAGCQMIRNDTQQKNFLPALSVDRISKHTVIIAQN
jgi:hypothetical protein